VSLSVKQRKVDQSEYIVATVRDTGRGIREEDKASLFDSFAQFDQQMNKGIVGTGLGLPITKQLTELMGGSVTVESEYGLGSTFTAYIPFVPGNPALVEDVSRNVRQAQVPSDAKVLAVDDMRLNLNVIQGMLERFDIHPETVESGEEALQKVATLAESGQRYDLIFMDHMMPGMDGLETTRRIRKLEEEEADGRGGKRAVIIAFSANVISGAQEEFLASGMDDCISKPVRLKELNKILVKWLSSERTPETELPQHEQRSLDGEKEDGSDCSAKSVESTESMDEREPDGTAPVAVTAIVPHSFRAQLQSLGLDTSIALEYLGTETALHIYLVRVVEDYEGYVATLRNAFAMGNWGDYKIGIHRLKCVFETMGARDLHARMLALETAAKEGRYEECEHGTPEVLETLADFHGKLTAALAVSA
jgi:CheY-like chemotaxis protein